MSSGNAPDLALACMPVRVSEEVFPQLPVGAGMVTPSHSHDEQAEEQPHPLAVTSNSCTTMQREGAGDVLQHGIIRPHDGKDGQARGEDS